METPIKILIVEDEMVIAANISLQLSELGYEVSGIVTRGEEALVHVSENAPHIVLLDIQLKGSLDGIETAKIMQAEHDVAIIYLTANADEAHFNRAKETHPHAFISKPFKKLDLQRAIALTVERLLYRQSEGNDENTKASQLQHVLLSDRIFVRHNDKMVKIDIGDILYVEADRNYCRIFSKAKEYLLVTTLKDMDEKLPSKHFMRIHRSYIINLSQIDEIGGTHVVIAKKAIPMTKPMRNELLKRLQTI
jgi:DNA-binding LytR/AlgR family response regulator